MTEPQKRRSLLRIAGEGLVRAPRRIKLIFVFNVVVIAGVAAVDIIEDIGTDQPAPVFRFTALALTMGGALLLSLASVLWTMSQTGQACRLIDFKLEAFRLRVRRLDEALIPFPVLAFVAGCMMTAGFTMYVTIATSAWVRGAIIGMAVWFFWWTTRMISATTRFLYTHAREQAEAAERARGEATESQLAALQAQMNPHFLFNTLNTVASLVRTDADAAEATVENLAVVLRRTLDRSRRVLSTVDDEIDYLAAYLSVAKQRFENRLQVQWSVDPATKALLLPTMTLQPLVENALKHGIGARLEGGALRIGVHVESTDAGDARETGDEDAAADRLVLEVADDGPGFPRHYEEGTGLSNLRERLETLYGDDAVMTVDRSAPGSRVVITLPVVEATEVESVIRGAAAAAARADHGQEHELREHELDGAVVEAGSRVDD